jgi:hypothetical protein
MVEQPLDRRQVKSPSIHERRQESSPALKGRGLCRERQLIRKDDHVHCPHSMGIGADHFVDCRSEFQLQLSLVHWS